VRRWNAQRRATSENKESVTAMARQFETHDRQCERCAQWYEQIIDADAFEMNPILLCEECIKTLWDNEQEADRKARDA
jgi:hypothetical protein